MLIQKLRMFVQRVLPDKFIQKLPPFLLRIDHYLNMKDPVCVMQFIFKNHLHISRLKRLALIWKLYKISLLIDSPHSQNEIITFMEAILGIPENHKGVIVEAGCYKGASTAKFSIAAKLAKRKMIVFDSFEGIPNHDEKHEKNIFGGSASFPKGSYCGKYSEVKKNVQRFGEIEVCEFVKGWFKDTLPFFKKKVAAAYLDVDLASSTKTCIKYLYPLLIPGGLIYSQDGHLPLVIDAIDDDNFWEQDVGVKKPNIDGLGTHKLVKIKKE